MADPEQRKLARANQAADEFAKAAAKDLHPQWKEEETNKELNKATEVAIALGRMAARWGQEPKLARMKVEGRKAAQAAEEAGGY